MNEEEIKIEDALSVLSDEPTINQRLDKLEKMMEMILSRLPYTTTGYSAPVWTTTTTSPYTVTVTNTGTTTASSNAIIKFDYDVGMQ